MDEISKKITKKAKEEEEERRQAEVDANNRSTSQIMSIQPLEWDPQFILTAPVSNPHFSPLNYNI